MVSANITLLSGVLLLDTSLTHQVKAWQQSLVAARARIRSGICAASDAETATATETEAVKIQRWSEQASTAFGEGYESQNLQTLCDSLGIRFGVYLTQSEVGRLAKNLGTKQQLHKVFVTRRQWIELVATVPDSKLDTHWVQALIYLRVPAVNHVSNPAQIVDPAVISIQVMEQELSILNQAMDGTGAVFTGMASIGNAVVDTTMETAGSGLQSVGSAFAIGGSGGKKKKGKHGLDEHLTDSTIMSHAGSVQWSGELRTGRGAD